MSWIGLTGATDQDLMPRIIADEFTFVTNSAADFRRLYARQPVHAGLVIIVSQVVPATQRALFDWLLDALAGGDEPTNEAIEIRLEDGDAVLKRYGLPAERV